MWADEHEGKIEYDPNLDKCDSLGELTIGKLYPVQRIPADNVVAGGVGSDFFNFQNLINSKALNFEQHTCGNRSVNRHGVAGKTTSCKTTGSITSAKTWRDFKRAESDRVMFDRHSMKIAYRCFLCLETRA